MSDEDDDVYFENNQVHQYLKSCTEFSGCYDVHQVHDTGPISCEEEIMKTDPKRICSPLLDYPFNQHNNPTLLLQLDKILKSGLMLEEDASYVESVIDTDMSSEMNVNLQSTWSTHRNKLLVVSSTCFISALQFPYSRQVTFPLGAVATSYTLWKYYEHRHQQSQIQRTVQLLTSLHQLFKVLKKSMQLVQETELVARGNILASSAAVDFSSLPNLSSKGQLMLSLRSNILDTVQKTVSILTNGTKQLIGTVPLVGQLNFSHNYLATLDGDPLTSLKDTEDLPLSYLKHNYNLYFLIQSEFLRRLALCFCPNLWNGGLSQQIQVVGLISSSLTKEVSQLVLNLQRDYKTCHTYGLKIETKHIKNPRPTWKYSDVYVAAHSAFLRLQAMLMKTSALQEELEKNHAKHPKEHSLVDLESSLEDVLKDTDFLECCFKEALVQLHKLKVVETQTTSDLVKPEPDNMSVENFSPPEDYVVEDEVFEALSLDSDTMRETSYCESTPLSKEEKVKREIEKQLSHRMVKELKIALVSKSNEWKERERKALLKKSGIDTSDLQKTPPLFDVPCNNAEWPLRRLKTSLPKRYFSPRSSIHRLSFDSNSSLVADVSEIESHDEDSPPCILPPLTSPTTMPLSPPPPPPPPVLPLKFPPLPRPTSPSLGETHNTPRGPSELQSTISKGAEQFWLLRNQPSEDIFSGSGENPEEEYNEEVTEDDVAPITV